MSRSRISTYFLISSKEFRDDQSQQQEWTDGKNAGLAIMEKLNPYFERGHNDR